MKKLLLCLVIFTFHSLHAQKQATSFDRLQEALKAPDSVRTLVLTSYDEQRKQLPKEFVKLKNLRKLYLGWCKNFNYSETFELLAQLPNLDTLELYACDLHELPASIGKLTNLRSLKINLNYLRKVSPEIGKLKKLEQLDLSTNDLQTLPEEIGALEQLNQLSLQSNDLAVLPAFICKLKNLQVLNIWDNDLTTLPSCISDLVNLKTLSVSGNPLVSVPTGIADLKLERLFIGGYSLYPFPYEIFGITSLKTLGIFYTVIDSFPAAAANLTQLESISMAGIRSLNWAGAFSKLSQLKNLKKMDLDFGGSSEMPPEISMLTSLRELKLEDSWRSYEAMKYVSALTNLVKLQFEDYTDSTLPPEIGQMKQLRHLELGKSKLTSLPASIGNLDALRELSVSSNWGQSISIPKEIGRLSKLEKLTLSYCHIKSLPDEICELANLQTLNLWDNSLTELPAGIGNLQKLSILYAEGNSLKTLPRGLYSLLSLKQLGLANNELTELDSNIYKLSALEDLDLEGNVNLKRLPDSFKNLRMLREVGLSNTHITQLPASLLNNASITNITLCKTIIDHPGEIDRVLKDRVEWEWDCRDLERELVDFEKKYGTESMKMYSGRDTLELDYTYAYNEPHVVDEEYWKTISIKLLKSDVMNNKVFTLPDPSIIATASTYGIWNDTEYTQLQGEVRVLESGRRKIKVAITLSGIYGTQGEREELLTKTLVFHK
ncbi:MAG: leucine rich repeat domain containing protein [Bacteroidetes bacterium]|nr:leucine rich repeat domain containing protein [Bacteroidota bacterium]